MRIQLLRPATRERAFGLEKACCIEPLGCEYIAAALEATGHQVTVHDLRFSPPAERLLRREKPHVVGIAASHTLDIPEVVALARRVKQTDPSIVVLVGGHGASVHPEPFFEPYVDAICIREGEQTVPDLVAALGRGYPLEKVPGFHVRADRADPYCRDFLTVPPTREQAPVDAVSLPARHALTGDRRHYRYRDRQGVDLVETARGYPCRSRIYGVTQRFDSTLRCRAIGSVCADFNAVGGNVFLADDVFWYPSERSVDLARELLQRGIRKQWILAQTLSDRVVHHPELLEMWRPMARKFDIFFGFEAFTATELAHPAKDSAEDQMEEAVKICRRLGYGITANFTVDPDWQECDFESLWDFMARLRLDHVGFAIQTPLPGTVSFEQMKNRIREADWSRYDMNHILWEPRLGRKRFFELFAKTWSQSALPVWGAKGVWSRFRQKELSHLSFLRRILSGSRRLFDPDAYLSEVFPPGAARVHAVSTAPSVSSTITGRFP